MVNLGAFFFGLVVGWISYRTLRRTKTNGVSDIAAVIGAVGGAAVLSLFPAGTIVFGSYSIGLAIGFFAYLITAGYVESRATKNKAFKAINRFLGSETNFDTESKERSSLDEMEELPFASHQRER